MKAEPARKSRTPKYPDRRELAHQTEPGPGAGPLCRIAFATASLGLLAACSQDSVEPRTAPPMSLVAPVFNHGKGIGSMGCVVVSPPSFMSEEEALQIIQSELKTAGVEFDKRNEFLGDLPVKHNSDGAIPEAVRPLQADLLCSEKNFAIEFVSERDCEDFGPVEEYLSTVSTTHIKLAAQNLEKRAKGSRSQTTLGVLYDPVATTDWREKNAEKDRKKAEDDLRAQVRDLVKWLKGQGLL